MQTKVPAQSQDLHTGSVKQMISYLSLLGRFKRRRTGDPGGAAVCSVHIKQVQKPSDACGLHLPDLLSLLRLAGGVLASHDLVDRLSEAAVGGQPPGRLPQLLHAAVVCVGDREGLGVFHCNQSTAWINRNTGSVSSDFLA